MTLLKTERVKHSISTDGDGCFELVGMNSNDVTGSDRLL